MGKEGMNDLISRAEMLNRLNDMFKAADVFPVKAYSNAFRMAIVAAETTPAVDAEPVRHGKWSKRRKIGDVWCCSECGFGQLVSASFMYKGGCIGHSDNRTMFCPNCGARMEAEVKE